MNKEIAIKWVKALRSGKYKQGKHNLCTILNGNKKFCCLGVLTDMYQKDCKAKKRKQLPSKEKKLYGEIIVGYNVDGRQDQALPHAVKNWAGMQDKNGMYWVGDKARSGMEIDFCSLADANDNGFTFKQIASFIEKHYEIL